MATPKPPDSRSQDVKRLLARTSVIRNACELDLLVFLYRHPRTLLTSEQLAGFVGYNIRSIAMALDAFIEAGLLARSAPQSMHAARMFLLLLDGPQGPPVRALLHLASSREGRRAVLEVLNARESSAEKSGAGPEMRVAILA
jgi:hypothetical protein